MIKLILTDIDGTILPKGQKVVSEKMLAAIHAAIDAGIPVGVATGRAVSGALPTFGGDTACVQTALATNGMQVYLDGDLIHEEYLDHDELLKVADAVRAIPGAGLICFGGPTLKEVHLVVGTVEGLRKSFPSYADLAIPADDVPSFPIVKANVYTPTDRETTQEVLDTLRAAVPGIGSAKPSESAPTRSWCSATAATTSRCSAPSRTPSQSPMRPPRCSPQPAGTSAPAPTRRLRMS